VDGTLTWPQAPPPLLLLLLLLLLLHLSPTLLSTGQSVSSVAPTVETTVS